MKDDTIYLKLILECIQKIEEDIACGHKIFMSTHLYQDAVLRNLHILSESSQRISENLKENSPNIEWKSISAFRNVLVHDYLGIDMDRIWQVITDDIPVFKESISKILTQTD